ncbi:MAG: hypothetical protein E4H20_10045 [Spirochaetales bacterium]|nr:MAG: hypothetical protein E4H20_10045 [Spirochaetales bacterium]
MDMWTITIIGVSTVFLALISLSFVLMLFRFIFAPRRTVKPSAKSMAQATPAVTTSPDGTIIAVITAAIAASTGHSAASFRIASVEAVGGFNTPAWGYIDRLARAVHGRQANI